jgi:hypothetical protein
MDETRFVHRQNLHLQEHPLGRLKAIASIQSSFCPLVLPQNDRVIELAGKWRWIWAIYSIRDTVLTKPSNALAIV